MPFPNERELESRESKRLQDRSAHTGDNFKDDRAADQRQVEQAKQLNRDFPTGSLADNPDTVDDSIKIVAITDGREEVLAERENRSTKSMEHLKSLGESDPIAQAMYEIRTNIRKLPNSINRSSFEDVIRDSANDYYSSGENGITESLEGGTHKVISLDDSKSTELTEGNDEDPVEAKPLRYAEGSVSAESIKSLEYTKKSKAYLNEARIEVEKQGQDPKTALVSAMKNSEVLMLGEYHETPNKMRDLGKEIIPNLTRAGATHFAIEVDSRFQPDLDEFMQTGTFTDDFKAHLIRYATLLDSPDYYDLLAKARDSGLKLIAVDKPRDPPPPPPPGQPFTSEHMKANRGRDKYMAKQIERVLANPKSKVLYWVGAGHGQDPPGNYDIAAEVLRQHGKVVVSVKPTPSDSADTLMLLCPDLKKQVAIPTASTEKFAQLPTNQLEPVERYGDYDIIVAFPRGQSGAADR